MEAFSVSSKLQENVDKDCSVRVAVRIRPQNSREKIDMCRLCVTVTPGEPQILLGLDKAFTFDHVFGENSQQNEIYSKCVDHLVEGALNGFNATVLAYGQTGSGKTYTMGTGFDKDINEHQGIIPRAVRQIFSRVESIQSQSVEDSSKESNSCHFSIAVQFLEIYNDDIKDLLDPFSCCKVLKVHEDACGQICVAGLTIKQVNSPQDAFKYLHEGALGRTTASTQMNDQSSRSHALFTILIRRQQVNTSQEGATMSDAEIETLTSKFHFVDLAGSERLKRTGATGERAREGISINSGLLSLGNCISALGDKTRRASHVPYRDSKLTRLLQDSLGGNSQTIMIACISPSDRDFMETLNTLKYANRAKNIRNKVQVNQDQSSRTISHLRAELAALQIELLEYKQGKRVADPSGNISISDTFYENLMLQSEKSWNEHKIKALEETIKSLTEQNAQYKLIIDLKGLERNGSHDFSDESVIANYIYEIENLKAKLFESQKLSEDVKNKVKNFQHVSSKSNPRANVEDPEELIALARKDVKNERELVFPHSGREINQCGNWNNSSGQMDAISDEEEDISETDDRTAEMQNDLTEINADIEIKTRLIEELERSQHRMQVMKSQYEEKLTVLNYKIATTQKERDEVLANLETQPGVNSKDKEKEIRQKYERRICDMKNEIKRMQELQREHLKQKREIKAQEFQLSNLRNQVEALKTAKVQLMHRISAQSCHFKEEENRKKREIAQLRKEQRKQLSTVKSLQSQVQIKEQILRRKTEEVTALRQNQRYNLTEKASGRSVRKSKKSELDMQQASSNWIKLSRAISNLTRKKLILVQLEKELERLVCEREKLSQSFSENQNLQNIDFSAELMSEEDTIKTNLSYIQENISHVQQAIMEFEEGKFCDTKSTYDIKFVIEPIRNLEEAKFIILELSESTIASSCCLSLSENRILELEALLRESLQENGIQQQLLQHFLAQNESVKTSKLFNSLNVDSSTVESNYIYGSQSSLESDVTYNVPSNAVFSQSHTLPRCASLSSVDFDFNKSSKIRKRTAQTQDLLFGDGRTSSSK